MKTPTLSKNFYKLAILFLGLSVLFHLFGSILFFQLGSQMYFLESFPGWALVVNIFVLIGDLFILKYYHSRKYRIAFSTGIIATSAYLLHFLLFYSLLITKELPEYYFHSIYLYFGTGLIYGLSLIFSRTGERSWLKGAGVFLSMLSLVLISTFYLSLNFQEIQTSGTSEEIQKWTSLVGSFFPLLFMLNFWDEFKALKAGQVETSLDNFSVGLGVLGLIAFLFTLPIGLTLAEDSNLISLPSWNSRSYAHRLLEARNYDSLLTTQQTPLIERKLSNPNPSAEAEALYLYLLDIHGKRTLSGQMSAPWGINELNYIQSKTGKQPALRGIDFIHQRENEAEVQNAIDWWNSGGIPTIMWHWGAPGIGEGYENSKKSIDINKCFIEGTKEHQAFWAELKAKADLLEKIRDAGVPVLWRPYHELDGHWFWYGKQGPELFKKLWITMYDYFVHERDLNNLIWVLCYTGSPDGSWFPGDAYVDIAAADTYDGGDDPQLNMYKSVKAIVQNKPMPIAYHECGVPPDPDASLDKGAMWLWWMEWHTNHLENIDVEYLNLVYQHELVITKDELPDIMEIYGQEELAAKSSLPSEK